MAITASQLVVKITTDSKEAESGMKGMGESITRAGGHMSNLVDGMLSMAGGISIANLASGAFTFLRDQLSDAWQAGKDANQVMAQLSAGLKSTNDASGQTTASLEGLATKLSETTGISKTAVETGQAMLLTFTGIGKDVFPQATQAVADLATKMNGGAIPSAQQMQQQALLLGKALNDPVKGVTALSREGVTFTDQQKAQIAAMEKAGNTAGAQSIILKELQKEFGGSATAAGNANGGMAILSAQFDNMKEQLGTALIPALSQLLTGLSPIITSVGEMLPGALDVLTGFINSAVMPAINDFSQWIKTDGLPDLKNLGDFVQTTVVPALRNLQQWVQTYVVPALDKLGQFVMTVVLPAIKQMSEWFMQHVMPVLAQVAQVILTNVLPTVEGLVGIILTKLVPSLEHLWNVIAPILIPVIQLLGWILQNVIGPVLGFVVEMIAHAIDGFASFIGSIEDFINNPSVHNLVNILQQIGNLISGTVGGILNGSISLPHFADGGTMQRDGYALVGERGPEIVALPGGAHVFPNHAIATAQPAAHGGHSGPTTVVLQMDGYMVGRALMPHLNNAIYNAAAARGVNS